MLGRAMGRGVLGRAALVLALVSSLTAVSAGPAVAATVVVTKTADTNDGICDADCSLREAVGHANANPDTVIALKAATYVLTRNSAGALDITEDATIFGQGPTKTVIAGEPGWTDRIIDIASGQSVELDDLAVTGGRVTSVQGDGAGIRNAGLASFENVVVKGNRGGEDVFGGGIANTGSLAMFGGSVTGNTAEGGGGVYAGGSFTTELTGTTVRGNTAAQFGGGLAIEGDTVLEGVRVTGNRATADEGGGIYHVTSSLSIQDTTIDGNRAGEGGGGISSDSGDVDIEESTLTANHAGTSGGAIAVSSTNAFDIRSVTVSGNTANENGGGIEVASGVADLLYVTVANNRAGLSGVGSGGGLFDGPLAFATSIKASIFAANTADGSAENRQECATPGGVTSDGSSIYLHDSECAGPGDETDVDPQLGPLANNGGPTRTHKIALTSSAVDLLDDLDSDCDGARDQRHAPRLGPHTDCDAGAYEVVLCRNVVVNIVGTGDDDTLVGTARSDGILGLSGEDTIIGGDGSDGICGNEDDDVLKGGPGRDKLDGGTGTNDACVGGPDTDSFFDCEDVS